MTIKSEEIRWWEYKGNLTVRLTFERTLNI